MKSEHEPITDAELERIISVLNQGTYEVVALAQCAPDLREARRLLRSVDTEVAVIHPDSMAEEIETYLAYCEGKDTK